MTFAGSTQKVDCAVHGCDRNAHHSARGGRGWCSSHYERWRKHGDPLGGKTSTGAPLAFLEQALIAETDDCMPWPFSGNGQGWGKLLVDGRLRVASRVVCERAHGAPPTPAHEAAHSCGNGHLGCVNPKHIRWATPSENEADKLIHGTHGRGARNSQAALTESDVRVIRARAAGGETQRAIARQYGVSEATVSLIVRRKSWEWLT